MDKEHDRELDNSWITALPLISNSQEAPPQSQNRFEIAFHLVRYEKCTTLERTILHHSIFKQRSLRTKKHQKLGMFLLFTLYYLQKEHASRKEQERNYVPEYKFKHVDPIRSKARFHDPK